MHVFEAIDILALWTVTGGAGDPPQSCTDTRASVGVGPFSASYQSKTCKTNEVQCAEDVSKAGGTAADVLKCYQPAAKPAPGASAPTS
jgi:hypothetical protein